MSLDQIKAELKALLDRDVGVEETRNGKWICQYVEYGMRPTLLLGDTEELAYTKLLEYLRAKKA